jgi:hypothetical protein
MYDRVMSLGTTHHAQSTPQAQAERVEAAVQLLLRSDLSTCGHRELDALSGALQRLRGFVTAYLVRVARHRVAELGRRRCRTGGGHALHEGHEPVRHRSGP